MLGKNVVYTKYDSSQVSWVSASFNFFNAEEFHLLTSNGKFIDLANMQRTFLYVLKRMEWPKEQEQPHIFVLLLRREFVTEILLQVNQHKYRLDIYRTLTSNHAHEQFQCCFFAQIKCIHVKNNALFATWLTRDDRENIPIPSRLGQLRR